MLEIVDQMFSFYNIFCCFLFHACGLGFGSEEIGDSTSAFEQWYQIGSYKYQQPTISELVQTFETGSEACSKIGATLATFPTAQEYKLFVDVWQLIQPFKYFMLGYIHLYGTTEPSDIVSDYDDQPILWTPSPFIPGEPDFQNELCTMIYHDSINTGIKDIQCSEPTASPLCQQALPYSTGTIYQAISLRNFCNYTGASQCNVRCSPLCRSETKAGHRLTTSHKKCGIRSKIQDKAIGYAMTEYMPGISEFVYEMKNAKFETLMIYGSSSYRKAMIRGYKFVSSFIVATQPSVYSSLYYIMTSDNSFDTLIVPSGSDEYQILLDSLYIVTASFYLFTEMNDNYTCNFKQSKPDVVVGSTAKNYTAQWFQYKHQQPTTVVSVKCYEKCSEAQKRGCVWGEWQPWFNCSYSCGNGTRQRIREKAVVETTLGSCNGLNLTTEACQNTNCPTSIATSYQKNCGMVPSPEMGSVNIAIIVAWAEFYFIF